ncbi:hypothetical protein BD410DRAFT_899016 [Rickenella mellea]|uniref:Uncharacterized protein n=1 Tax=Rickenella mellea TaxID=50990 RepID=A0A4Y7Q0J5_9AGAM|nr:hypothetical protein BD410DRAFT_899016 [Rickenella mellea]
MPKLSHFYGLSILTAYNPIITQLTSVDLQYSGEYFDVPSLARTLYQATNLQDLSLELRKLKVAEQATRLTSDKMPEPHSFSIKSLKLDIKGDVTMSYDVIRPLCGALSYLSPLKVDISCPLESHYYQDGTVTPYGSEIRICIAESTDIVQLLAKLVQQCSIARSVCIEAPASYFSTYYLGGGNWTWFSSLRYIRFHNCGGLTEEQVKPFAISLLADEAGMNLQSLEFTSCGNISEDFLLNLSDIVGQKLKWSR